jgi:hypothetical protein
MTAFLIFVTPLGGNLLQMKEVDVDFSGQA